MADETEEDRTADLNIRGMSPDLRQQFKVLCAQRNTNMTEAAISLIEGAVMGLIKIPFNEKPASYGKAHSVS
jgi:hypothetical protein